AAGCLVAAPPASAPGGVRRIGLTKVRRPALRPRFHPSRGSFQGLLGTTATSAHTRGCPLREGSNARFYAAVPGDGSSPVVWKQHHAMMVEAVDSVRRVQVSGIR